jgi:hypothetical protein
MFRQRLALVATTLMMVWWGSTHLGSAQQGDKQQRPVLTVQLGHHRGVRSVAFSPDAKQVLTGSFDMTALGRPLLGRRHAAAVPGGIQGPLL